MQIKYRQANKKTANESLAQVVSKEKTIKYRLKIKQNQNYGNLYTIDLNPFVNMKIAG